MKMDWSALISVLIAIIGIYLSYRNLKRGLESDTESRRKSAEKRQADEAKNHTEIKLGIDGLNLTLREVKEQVNLLDRRIDDTSDRITRVEEAAKSAHKRIDRMEAAKCRDKNG